MSLRICDWKYGKRWVYSITYDEALIDLHRFAVPYHEEFGIPGHLEVVVGQMGEVRQIDGSSFNGYRHMNADELKDLMARGWGVGNHSWTHVFIKPEMVDQELRVAREVLEQAIDAPVPLYCAPGSNRNMAPHILEACRQLGYLGAMSIREGINRPADECYWLDRSPLIHEYPRLSSANTIPSAIFSPPASPAVGSSTTATARSKSPSTSIRIAPQLSYASAWRQSLQRAATKSGAPCPKKSCSII